MIVAVVMADGRYGAAVAERGGTGATVIVQGRVHGSRELLTVQTWTDLVDAARQCKSRSTDVPAVYVELDAVSHAQWAETIRLAAAGAGTEVLAVVLLADGASPANPGGVASRARGALRERSDRDERSGVMPSWLTAVRTLPVSHRLRSESVQRLTEDYADLRGPVNKACGSNKARRRTAEKLFGSAVDHYRGRFQAVRAMRVVITGLVAAVLAAAVVITPIAMSLAGLEGLAPTLAMIAVAVLLLVPYLSDHPDDHGERVRTSLMLLVMAVGGFWLAPVSQLVVSTMLAVARDTADGIVALYYLTRLTDAITSAGLVIAIPAACAFVAVQLTNLLRRQRRGAYGYVMLWSRHREMLCELAQVIRLVRELDTVPDHHERRRHLAVEKLRRLAHLCRLEASRARTPTRRRRQKRDSAEFIRLSQQLRDDNPGCRRGVRTFAMEALVLRLVQPEDDASEDTGRDRARPLARLALRGLAFLAVVAVTAGVAVLAPTLGPVGALQVVFAAAVFVFGRTFFPGTAAGPRAAPALPARRLLATLLGWMRKLGRRGTSTTGTSPDAPPDTPAQSEQERV